MHTSHLENCLSKAIRPSSDGITLFRTNQSREKSLDDGGENSEPQLYTLLIYGADYSHKVPHNLTSPRPRAGFL